MSEDSEVGSHHRLFSACTLSHVEHLLILFNGSENIHEISWAVSGDCDIGFCGRVSAGTIVDSTSAGVKSRPRQPRCSDQGYRTIASQVVQAILNLSSSGIPYAAKFGTARSSGIFATGTQSFFLSLGAVESLSACSEWLSPHTIRGDLLTK